MSNLKIDEKLKNLVKHFLFCFKNSNEIITNFKQYPENSLTFSVIKIRKKQIQTNLSMGLNSLLF